MQFKRSAGIFVTGMCFMVGGPLLSIVGSSFGTWAAFTGLTGEAASSEIAGLFIVLMMLGGILSLTGFCLTTAAAYRALVKIDALPVGIPYTPRNNWAPTGR